jgi:hypothetical protein
MSPEYKFKDISVMTGIQGQLLGNGLFNAVAQIQEQEAQINVQQMLLNMQIQQLYGLQNNIFSSNLCREIVEPKEKFFTAKSSLGLTVELKWIENLVGNEEDYYLIKSWGKWKPANDKWKQYIKTCMLLED